MKEPLILIIDDNFDSRLAVRSALRKKGYLFLEAQDAKEGIDMAIEHNPDLIIMDIMMPQINGYEALRIIKGSDKTKHIPVLIVSALSSMNEKIVALEYGADGMLTKPFDRIHLAEQIEALVGFYKNGLNTKAEIIEQKERLDNVLHRQSEELIRYYYTDALTGLPNRSQLIKDIVNAVNSSLILIDIDGFKDIVYFYGHETGDLCLKSFALKIKQLLKGDKYKHYRISGDIFAVLVKECSAAEELNNLMRQFVYEMNRTNFLCEGHEMHFRFTVGASMFESELLISAEKALKTAKTANKTILLYDEKSEEFRFYEQNIFWVNKIVEAISCDNIVTFYQPIINNKTHKIEKYECLVRIIERDGTIYAPIKFLDISKKSKHYAAITKNVIEKSFKKFKNSDCQFSINLSAKDMIDSEISEYIYDKLNSFNGCNRVIFELLESEGVENYSAVYAFISKVKEYGCQIAIDDFGSGYSNFIHLLRLKVDIIKIDGSLIRDLDIDENAQIMVQTIVDFAKKLGILTVAEFVHSESISRIVKDLGVDYSQGYFIGEPSNEI
ncbi:MAG: diguanylate cyclase [Sulfurimonas sp.]|nr:MAG: diguanylate cyclase [Sulfurimonas sp.]